MAYTAGSVMDYAANCLNDRNRTLYTYTVQLPYLRMAIKGLEKDFILHNVPLQLEVSSVIPVVAGESTLTLPADFFIPISLEERRTGSTKLNDFFPLKEKTTESGIDPVINLYEWAFREGEIKFNPATENKDIRLTYYRFLPNVASELTNITEDGASITLAFKTGELLAKYIGGNLERAASLREDYETELDKLLSVYVRAGQHNRVRRRPFRVGR